MSTPNRIISAVVLALLGCAAVWIATPYNNFILRNGFISDDFLPRSVMVVLLLLVLVVNPLLRATRPAWALNFKQMTFIAAILLVACSVTSSGVHRFLPYSLAVQTREASEWKDRAEFLEKADLPPSLFPAKIGYHEDVDVAKHFLLKLPEGASIPWGAWAAPALSWGCFFIFLWMLAIGLAGILLPQWQHRERMAMPLTRLLQSVLETPEEGRILAPLFRRRPFWIAVAGVFTIHLFAGLNIYFPGRVPPIDANWNLYSLFSEEPLVYMPWYMKSGTIYFTFVGVAYFMSTRVSFSIWFFMIFYAFLNMFWQMYSPPFSTDAPTAHRSGAMLAMTCFILWLSRERWLEVFRCLFRGDDLPADSGDGDGDEELPGTSTGTWLRWGLGLVVVTAVPALVAQFASLWVAVGLVAVVLGASLIRRLHSDESRRDRQFAFMFAAGAFGMFAWLVWAGVQIPWALMLVAIMFMYQLLMTRILAETGLPLIGLYDYHFWHYFSFIPIKLVNATSAWFIGAQSAYAGHMTRASLGAFAMQSMSLDEEAGPRYQWRMGRLFLVVLALGFVASGAVHLYFSYHHSQSLDRNPEVPVSQLGGRLLDQAMSMLRQETRGEWDKPSINRPLHVGLGAAVAGGLQLACSLMPKFPLHPVGLLLSYTVYGWFVWMSVLFGWLARVTILLFGGPRLFRNLRPFFIGLIMGEIAAVVFWSMVCLTLAMSGKPYHIVQILPV